MTDRMLKAVEYGFRIHSDQKRKGTDVPYISHLLAVMGIVLENGGSEDEAIAAFLHDAVEDGGGQKTFEEIQEVFGSGVAGIVAGCTDAWMTPKPPWRERKEKYLRHIGTATASELLVSIADKLHNARSVLYDFRTYDESLWGRFNPDAGRPGTLWYYRALVTAFRKRGVHLRLVDELDWVVTELEEVTGFL